MNVQGHSNGLTIAVATCAALRSSARGDLLLPWSSTDKTTTRHSLSLVPLPGTVHQQTP